jgi:hypothetical protein
MQPLSQYDLYLNLFVAVVMPILIVTNLMDWGTKSPLNVYLWREHPNLMRVSLVLLGLLALNAFVDLAAHYGLLPAAAADYATPLLGIPFLIASVAVIWLSVKAVLQYLRARRSQAQ